MMNQAKRCSGCGERTSAHGDFCRTCQSKLHHAHKRIEREGLIVDKAGGSWWIWDAKGEVLVIGVESKRAAIEALAFGE